MRGKCRRFERPFSRICDLIYSRDSDPRRNMVSIVKPKSPQPEGAEPAWDIARLFPLQGYWDEDDYLSLDTNYLVEFTDGFVEVLSMPKPSHQRIVQHLLF